MIDGATRSRKYGSSPSTRIPTARAIDSPLQSENPHEKHHEIYPYLSELLLTLYMLRPTTCRLCVDSSMATVEQLAQALTEVRQQLGEAQRLAQEAQRAGVQASMASTGQVDPRGMNKCPTFSGGDAEWRAHSLGRLRNRLQSSLLR